ncbi:ThiF family adenylyltransferase [Actinobacteria bacterium YIM 96077]|uniref:ThiF family adenylyltransferase n=1 Tax=Phytoactinopolyspora halophila TaxID=1981511 RepID=A0A329R486_9ACTN|nr:ThiF family adenylyltransferase [Phytoactinopolyspora halophila]AYY11960.1 ThiF family adenylyltransferase [Actinobacteria bacterium YIM 96077]RAW18806.1 ThiF family adenylyltransferase [Phytoactinopolyspora halophila]
MRPLLHPSLSQIWRDTSTIQIGVTPGCAVVLTGLGNVEKALLRSMDGRNDQATLQQLALAWGADSASADKLIETLAEAGAVIDGDQLPAHSSRPAGRLEPDRASLGLVEHSADAGYAGMERRAQRRVEVVGAGRVGASVARLLAAGGVGAIDIDDGDLVAPSDVTPLGHDPGAVGLGRDRSLRPSLDIATANAVPGEEPDFVLFTVPRAYEHASVVASLMRAGIPHLQASVTELTGVVGPLVVPGSSACLRCLDLHRTDRDAGWPTVLDQATRHPPPSPACDTSLVATVAGLASAQILAFLDGYHVASIGGTLECELPYGLPRRRTWRTHPDCGCTWEHECVPEDPDC